MRSQDGNVIDRGKGNGGCSQTGETPWLRKERKQNLSEQSDLRKEVLERSVETKAATEQPRRSRGES